MELNERKELIAKAELIMKQNGLDPLSALKKAEELLKQDKENMGE